MLTQMSYFLGQVLYIAPAATTATSANDSVTYEVAVELLGESPENVQLAGGMTIDGEILVSEQEDCCTRAQPSDYLQHRPSQLCGL